MGSFGGTKTEPRGLWPAIAHRTEQVVAYGFGRRTDEVLVKWKTLLAPCGLPRYDTDDWGAYARNLAPEVRSPGKRHTPPIERNPLTWRTRLQRLVRQTIGFSNSLERHDLVLGLFLHRYEFRLPV